MIIIKPLLLEKEYIFKTVVAFALVFRSWSGARPYGNRGLAYSDLWSFVEKIFFGRIDWGKGSSRADLGVGREGQGNPFFSEILRVFFTEFSEK